MAIANAERMDIGPVAIGSDGHRNIPVGPNIDREKAGGRLRIKSPSGQKSIRDAVYESHHRMARHFDSAMI